jgi:hypothetical protein
MKRKTWWRLFAKANYDERRGLIGMAAAVAPDGEAAWRCSKSLLRRKLSAQSKGRLQSDCGSDNVGRFSSCHVEHADGVSPPINLALFRRETGNHPDRVANSYQRGIVVTNQVKCQKYMARVGQNVLLKKVSLSQFAKMSFQNSSVLWPVRMFD